MSDWIEENIIHTSVPVTLDEERPAFMEWIIDGRTLFTLYADRIELGEGVSNMEAAEGFWRCVLDAAEHYGIRA